MHIKTNIILDTNHIRKMPVKQEIMKLYLCSGHTNFNSCLLDLLTKNKTEASGQFIRADSHKELFV